MAAISGRCISIKLNKPNQLVTSDGYYPTTLSIKQEGILHDQLFIIYTIVFDNDEYTIEDFGQQISFSQDIIIQHMKSKKYLSAIMVDEKLSLALIEQVDRRSFFRIEPCYKSQVQNSNIVNLEDDIYLQLSQENLANVEHADLYQEDIYINITDKNFLILSNQQPTVFQLHQVFQEQETKLKYGDYIQIQALEHSAYLSIQSETLWNDDLQSRMNFIFSDQWSLIWKTSQMKELWKIYNPLYYQQPISEPFFLQNFQNNMFIKEGTLTNNIHEATLFQFEEVKQSNSTLYMLKEVNSGNYLSYNHNSKSNKLEIQYKEEQSKLDLLQIDNVTQIDKQEQAWFDSVVYLFNNSIKYFQKNRILQSLKEDQVQYNREELYFLLSQIEECIKDLIFYCSTGFDKNNLINRDSIKYIKTQVLHQDMLREKRIFQLLIQLVEEFRWDNECTAQCSMQQDFFKQSIFMKQESQDEANKILQIFKDLINLIFLFVEVYSSNHSQNSLLVFGSYHRIKQFLGLNIGAFYCFLRLFESNQDLIPLAGIVNLDSKINQNDFKIIKRQTRITTTVSKSNGSKGNLNLIEDLFNLAQLSQKKFGIQYWANILKLLCILCIYNNRACFYNQMIIGRNFQIYNLLIPTTIREDGLVNVNVGDQIELNELYIQSWRAGKTNLNSIKLFQLFFDTQLQLISVCCQERNYENIQLFRNILPQDTLVKYVYNYKNNEILRCRLIGILMNLYVDFYPYQPKQNPKLIINSQSLKLMESASSLLNGSEYEMIDLKPQKSYSLYTRDDMSAVTKLLEITTQIIKSSLIQQNTVNLILSVQKVLDMYFKLYTFNLPNQNVEIVFEAFILLPESLSISEPSQEFYQEYQQYQQRKEIFNSIAQIFFQFIKYFIQKGENKLLQKAAQFEAVQLIQNYKFKFADQIETSIVQLLKHPQMFFESKLKALDLLFTCSQPKRNIVKRMKKIFFIENQQETQAYQLFKKTQKMLYYLESLPNKTNQYKEIINLLVQVDQTFDETFQLQYQIIFRLLNIDQQLLEFLDSYTQICSIITQKYIRSYTDDRYVIQLNDEEEQILEFCRVTLKILKKFIKQNHKNKQRILKQFHKIDELMNCINIGQYDLFCSIYEDQIDLVQQVSPNFIKLLLQNCGSHQISVLNILIFPTTEKEQIDENKFYIQKNIDLIISLFQKDNNFIRLFGIHQTNVLKQLQVFNSNYQTLSQLGKCNYLLQADACFFVSKLFHKDNNKTELSKLFQEKFQPESILKLMLKLPDLFSRQSNNLDEGILTTILRLALQQLLSNVLQAKGNLILEEGIHDLLIAFLDLESNKFNLQNYSLTIDQFLSTQDCDNQKKYELLQSYFHFKDQGKIYIETKSQSDGSDDEDNDDSKLIHQIALETLTKYYELFHSNNYLYQLFGFLLNLAQIVLDQLALIDESNQKNYGRSTSLISRQLSLSSIKDNSNQLQLNIKINQLNKFQEKLYQIIEHLGDVIGQSLSKWMINKNIQQILSYQELFFQLTGKKLEFESCKISPNLKQAKFIDPYANHNYIYDQRIFELTKLYKMNQNSKYLSLQLSSLTDHRQEVLNERISFISQLLIYESKDQDQNTLIQSIIQSLEYGIQNSSRFHKISLQILEMLQHMIDLYGIGQMDPAQTIKNYQNVKKQIFQSKSDQIILYKSVQTFQQNIVESGFYKIFLYLSSNYEDLQITKYQEYTSHNLKLKQELFYQFVLTSIKLIKGYESANNFSQSQLLEEIVKVQNNYIFGLFQQHLLKDPQIQFELDRLLLSYQFNEVHFLEDNNLRQGLQYNITRLMQLLTEDHFRPFQDFFRQQVGFFQNYDLLDSLIQILQKQFTTESFQALSYDEYIHTINTFDCLKEFIQGPCPKNQEKVCSTAFLRLCLKLLSYDDSQTKFLEQYTGGQQRERQLTITQSQKLQIIQDKTQIQQNIVAYYVQIPSYCKLLLQSFRQGNPLNFRLHQLSQIKYRCATTLESLIDSDQEINENIGKIAGIINEKLLIKNLTMQYEKYKILYGSGKNYNYQVFTHQLGIPPDFNIKQKKESQNKSSIHFESNYDKYQIEEESTVLTSLQDFWLSFIIDTGFSLYVLLDQIYTYKGVDILERIQEQISITKQKKKEQQKLIIYQLFNFVFQATNLSTNLVNNDSEKVRKNIFTKYQIKKSFPGEQAQQKKLGYRALRFFATRTGQIEILLTNKSMKKIVFPLMPHCFVLSKQIKEKFSDEVNRLSQYTKVESVLELSSNVITKLKSEYRFQLLYKSNLIMNLLVSNLGLWKQVIFVIIVLENILILLSSNGQPDPVMDQVVLILNYIQLAIQFLCFFIFIIKKLPYLQLKAAEEVKQRQVNRIRTREIKYKYLDNTKSIVQQEDFVIDKVDVLLQEQNKYKKIYNSISDSLILWKMIFLDFEMIYFLIFTAFGIIGLFFRIALAALLLDVFWRFPMLASIVNSIWRPKKQIILILSLFIIMQYYYSLVVFQFYADDYYPVCQNLLQCFSFIFDVTFKTDGGIVGYFMGSEQYQEEVDNPSFRFSLRNLLEFIYVFVVISLLYSIITGIIIDTFGVLRDEAEELEKDIQGFCLICGIDRGTIEKKAKHKKGFHFHVKHEHSVWNYIFYISYLEDKTKSEQNGTESYVDNELKKENISWFPIGKALSIPEDKENEEEIQQQIQAINQRLKIMQDIIVKNEEQRVQNN